MDDIKVLYTDINYYNAIVMTYHNMSHNSNISHYDIKSIITCLSKYFQ